MGLLDFLQSASNSAAGTVTGPVDALAWLLKKAGVDVGEPVGGSDWAKRQGLMRDVPQSASSLAGETVGLLSPMAAAAKAPQIAKGLLNAVETGPVPAKIGTSNARSSVNIYDPKPLPQRPFYDDYPRGASGPDGSRLTADIDGRPLSPTAYIAGRRVGGGVDEGLGAVEAHGIADALRVPVSFVAPGEEGLGKAAGRYFGGPDRRIVADKSHPPEKVGRVLQHEVGHLIDDMAMGVIGPKGSRIPIDGLEKELRQVYSDLNTGAYVPKGKLGARPEDKYPKDEAGAEMMAEAIRAYGRDPNYLKSIAPKTAARIRAYVNANPNLKDIIQFNSAAGAGLLGASMFDGGMD